MARARPRKPRMTNIQRQPAKVITKVRIGGARAWAMAGALFHTPVALVRRSARNQSRTTAEAAGNIGPSPIPSRARAATNGAKPVISPPAAWAADHSTSPTPRARLGPTRSSSAPIGSWTKA